MDFEKGFLVFLGCFFVGGGEILSICWFAGDWGDCGYFKGWMGFLGRVGEERGEYESGTLVRWRGGEEKGREEEERKGRMMGLGRDGDGMVYVYMIVQMSMKIRDSQTRKSESFLWEKKSSCDKKKTGSVSRLLSAHLVNIRHRNKQVLGTGILDSAAAFLIISFSHRCWPHLTTQDGILFKSARDV